MTPSISPRTNTVSSSNYSGITVVQLYELVTSLTRREHAYTILFIVFVLWPLSAGSFWFFSAFSALTYGEVVYMTYYKSLFVTGCILAVSPVAIVALTWLFEKGYMLPLMVVVSFWIMTTYGYLSITAEHVSNQAQIDGFILSGFMFAAFVTFVYQIVRYGRYGNQSKS